MTRAQEVHLVASTAGMLAMSHGQPFATPEGRGAVVWCSGPLQAILWADADVALVEVRHRGRKMMAKSWRPGAERHEALVFKRGPWVQALECAGQALVEGMKQT